MTFKKSTRYALYAAMDILTLPSHREGFPNVILEASAMGLPVVATDASSLPELVVSGETGQLFSPGDGAALVAALTPYLEDPSRRKRHGENGRARAAREFPLARRLDELERLLEEEVAATTPG